MKKLFLFAVLGAFAVGCSSSNKKQEDTAQSLTDQYSKYQIVDQEFDNLVVPNDSYDRVSSYEDQVGGASYIQSSARKTAEKPARKMNVQKTVVDGEGNPMPADVSAPVTDQEGLPDDAEAAVEESTEETL
ncbi:MAG: hypothetical protein IKJ44_02170 [Elusimicrobiaceae bacterium]|nr:hypothetical protein [Elusimicrobiaceae bacterium]MBR3899059.1 hypothetical protein [Elusimicrobiaceae bacterium]